MGTNQGKPKGSQRSLALGEEETVPCSEGKSIDGALLADPARDLPPCRDEVQVPEEGTIVAMERRDPNWIGEVGTSIELWLWRLMGSSLR
jgi:hypothetical protein